jgi:hypothetical protein
LNCQYVTMTSELTITPPALYASSVGSRSFKVKAKLFQCTSRTYRGKGDAATPIANLDTRCRWTVSFTPQPIYAPEKRRRGPHNRTLGWLDSRSGGFAEEIKPLLLPGTEPRLLHRPARRLVTIATELPRIL